MWVRNRRENMRKKFNRTLPANELLGDRWEKARSFHATQGSVFGDQR